MGKAARRKAENKARRKGWGHTNGLCVANPASKDRKEARALEFLNILSAKPPWFPESDSKMKIPV